MSSSANNKDPSNGWEAIANKFISIATRGIGADVVANWSKSFKPGQTILDIGCGFGGSYTQHLIDSKIRVYGIDASTTLAQEHRKRFPEVLVRCESAEDSSLLDQKFDGILSVGLIFLLSPENQILVLQKMATALREGGRILFSSPYQVCEWDDLLTDKKSRSLGRDVYKSILGKNGLSLVNEHTDEGENHYYDFQKNGALPVAH